MASYFNNALSLKLYLTQNMLRTVRGKAQKDQVSWGKEN
jgi:hypothetical protein